MSPKAKKTATPGPKFYEISTGENWKGTALLHITLPGGFVSKFNAFQGDRTQDDYPAARVQLTPEQVANYRGSGLQVVEISKEEFESLDAMTDSQLWQRAFGLRLRLDRKLKRADLIKAITEASS